MAVVTERIAALEKSSYEGVGKQKLADPMMVELVAEMKRMAQTQATGGGKSEGIKDVWGWLVGAFGIGAAIAAWMKIGG